ncbi:MAG TPA: hypothetical protein DDZ51_04895 [Planctomycetaceae bacterium]|nr:hypothetical protein [Planctomycetaceae bacterium]
MFCEAAAFSRDLFAAVFRRGARLPGHASPRTLFVSPMTVSVQRAETTWFCQTDTVIGLVNALGRPVEVGWKSLPRRTL